MPGTRGAGRPGRRQPVLLVLCGPSHAGKSTFAARHCKGFEVVNSDRTREGLTGRCPRSRREARTWEAFEQQKQEALRNGRDVVLDACHLTRRARWHSVQGPNARHHKVCTVFDLPLEAVLARCRRTGRLAPDEVERMWRAFHLSKPTADELERLGFDEVHVLRDGGRRTMVRAAAAVRRDEVAGNRSAAWANRCMAVQRGKARDPGHRRIRIIARPGSLLDPRHRGTRPTAGPGALCILSAIPPVPNCPGVLILPSGLRPHAGGAIRQMARPGDSRPEVMAMREEQRHSGSGGTPGCGVGRGTEEPTPRRLPIVWLGDRPYFRDDRLREFRAVENPHDRIPFGFLFR